MTKILYLKLISAFCIFTFCKNQTVHATEISPIIGIGQENFTFDITEFDPNDKNKKINFEPNISGVLRLGVNAFGFGVGYGFRGSAKDTDISKGKTDFSDWQLGYNSKNWGVETFYQTYEGFYTSNTEQIQKYPNINFRHIGITARYALGDEEFSVGAMMDQSSDIKETSGKYYLLGGYDEHDMKTDSSLLQQENAGINSELESLRLLKSSDIKAGFGAGKYWVFSNVFFIAGMIDFLATYANYNFETTSTSSSQSDTTGSFNLRLAFGYKESNFRIGFIAVSDSTTLKTNSKGFLKPSANKLLVYLRFFEEF